MPRTHTLAFSPEFSEFLRTIPAGARSYFLEQAGRATPEFKGYWQRKLEEEKK